MIHAYLVFFPMGVLVEDGLNNRCFGSFNIGGWTIMSFMHEYLIDGIHIHLDSNIFDGIVKQCVSCKNIDII